MNYIQTGKESSLQTRISIKSNEYGMLNSNSLNDKTRGEVRYALEPLPSGLIRSYEIKNLVVDTSYSPTVSGFRDYLYCNSLDPI